jgi:tetratricopeptide (TPR) repeat protein
VKIGKDNFINGNGNVDSLSCIQMHQIAQQLNNDSLLGISYNWIGDYFLFNKADNTTALEYLFKSIPLAVKVKDKRTISSVYLDIALAYFNLNNPQDAIKYIRKAGDNLPDRSSPLYDYMARQISVGHCKLLYFRAPTRFCLTFCAIIE